MILIQSHKCKQNILPIEYALIKDQVIIYEVRIISKNYVILIFLKKTLHILLKYVETRKILISSIFFSIITI